MTQSTNLRDRALAIIERNTHMVIASTDADGRPWVSPVFYAYDHDHVLYWVSSKHARHSENIRGNPEVGIVIYETEAHTDALYIEAAALELNDPGDLPRAVEVMQSRQQPERWMVKGLADVTGEAVWRIYRAKPQAAYLRDETTENGQPVVRRTPVRL